MIVVSDTSPLTALLTVGAEDLLPQLFSEVVIPEAARDELLQRLDQKAGVYLTESLREQALKSVGE